MKDKEICEITGLNKSVLSRMKKQDGVRYALYQIGCFDYLTNRESQEWQKVKSKDLAEALGASQNTITAYKKDKPLRFEILKRGLLVRNLS